MNRRSFIYQACGVTLSLPVLSRPSRVPYLDQIGLQLYTLRKPIAQNLSKAIDEVAGIGYKQVESYGFPSAEAIEMIKRSRGQGMQVNSSHFTWDSLLHPEKKGVKPFEEVLQLARKHGLSDLVVPYLSGKDREGLAGYEKTADALNEGADQAKRVGIRLAYHNHAFEFKPMNKGKTGFDVFVERFSPDMFFEVDVFWVKVGGVDPVVQLAKLKNRVSQVHLKDLNKGSICPNFGKVEPDAFDEIGDGMIPMLPVMKAARNCGVKHCHVEQDHSPSPLKSVRKSLKYLNS